MACGRNNHGQLGLGDTEDRDKFTTVAGLRGVVDIDAGGWHSIAVTCEGEVWTWGEGRQTGHGVAGHEAMPWLDRVLVPTKVTGGGIDAAVVVQVAAGYDQSMALTAAGELWTWGGGSVGSLATGIRSTWLCRGSWMEPEWWWA